MFSSTVSPRSSRDNWKVRIRPVFARWSGRIPRRLLPFRLMPPESGSNTPASTLNNVDLPAPFGPMMPVTVPRSISSVQRESAWKPPNDFMTSVAASI
jgi:hypothetical protein